MLHFLQGFPVVVFSQTDDPPVLENARMEKILVDRREFVLQNPVQKSDDLRVALHG